MLDVLHYLLDEDLSYKDGDEAKAKGIVRATLYRHLLEKDYKYAPDSPTTTRNLSSQDDDMFDDSKYASQTRELKPFIPATNVDFNSDDPFRGILREAPLG